MTVGVLALQGSFLEHKKMIERLGCESLEVRKVNELGKIDALIIPGGESTTMNHHLALGDFRSVLVDKINSGFPVYGTCAGAILLAKTIDGKENKNGLAVMDIDISRNAYGSQMDSFEEIIKIVIDGEILNVPAVYIRAPKINSVGSGVEILSKNQEGEIVMARQGKMLVTTFHPELTHDKSVHSYFLERVIQTL
ncbi:pyridoxal 5'-phosphate synthase glutaminase subunit PdxT [bacterium]|nr:pyridoxal 5'-phosphate synthase glutaminase subunit PdxT [bacterium]